MVQEIRPDIKVEYPTDSFKIFLAGTIDNGDSVDWQREVIKNLVLETRDEKYGLLAPGEDIEITVFNPRREHWKPGGIEAIMEDIAEQILWEEEKLDEADLILMVIQDGSKSPVSLMELGLYGPSGKMIVFCTDKFYRYTNVRMTCEKYLIPLVNSTYVDDILPEVYKALKDMR